jgi:hypothetical protein
VDGNAVVPDVEDAIAAGIKVVAIDVVIGPDARTYEPYGGIVSYIGRTGIDHGTFVGQMIVRACAEVEDTPCEVGYLNGVQALTIDRTGSGDWGSPGGSSRDRDCRQPGGLLPARHGLSSCAEHASG